LLLAFFLPTKMNGTTIVTIRTGRGFVVAADSRVSDNSNRVLPGLACKVFEAKNGMVWGIAGFLGSDAIRPIDVIRPLIVGADVAVVSKRLEGVFVPLLTKEAVNLQVVSPGKFNYLVHGNDMFSVFVISKTRAILQGFSVKVTGESNVRVALSSSIECDISFPSCAEGKIMRLGQYAQIDQFVQTHREKMKQFASYADMARFLVQFEIDANPNQVGPPIDIVEIDGDGIHWKSRKPECGQ
jgi:hypothetical protein